MGATMAAGLALALFSAIMSACAHALLKSGDDKLAVLAWIRIVEFFVALPLVLWVGLPPAELWPWLIAAVAVHAVYQLILGWSYSVSDFTAAYPIARGFVPIFTALLGMTLLGDRLDLLTLAAIAVVSIGILFLAARGSMSPPGLLAAACTGLLTTCYTLVDAHGVRLAPEPLTFIAWFLLLGSVAMPVSLFIRSGRRSLALLRHDLRAGVPAGIMALVSFVPALFAFGMAPVGAVSALRETSVLIGLAIGALILKERLGWRRVSGAALVTAGTLGVIARAAFS